LAGPQFSKRYPTPLTVVIDGVLLERIADHGVNIAKNVTFMATGHFPDEDW
jgi:hypothetical protein